MRRLLAAAAIAVAAAHAQAQMAGGVMESQANSIATIRSGSITGVTINNSTLGATTPASVAGTSGNFNAGLTVTGSTDMTSSANYGLSLRGTPQAANGMLHIRPNSGSAGYITFTEDAVNDNLAIGFAAGTQSLRVLTGGNVSTGVEQFRVNHVASAVNYVFASGAATGGAPVVRAAGANTNIDLILGGQGTGSIRFFGETLGSEQLRVTSTASASRFVQITGSNGGNPAITASAGNLTIGGSTLPGATLLISATAPTISSGFGTSPSVSANNGTGAFRVNVGTGGTATSGVIGLPAATTGWNCSCSDITTASATVFLCKQTASSTTSATIGNFNTAGAAAAWVASDSVAVSCFAL